MIYTDRDMVVVVLTNLRTNLTWASMVADAIEGEFVHLSDLHATIDIVLMSVIGVAVVAVFAQILTFFLGQRVPSIVVSSVSLVLSGGGLLLVYAGLPVMTNAPLSTFLSMMPASGTPAIVALWAMLAVSVTSLLANVFMRR
jgi:uncharacterized membrane protein